MLKDLLTGKGYDRRWVPLDAISPHLVHAVMMSEDGQFCSHDGIDWGDAGIGAGSLLGVIALGLAAAVTILHRRRRAGRAATVA